MKVLFIADNRCRPNWGCRATSAALSQLLARSHAISARISGALTLDRVMFDLIFPELAAVWYPPQRSLRRRGWHVRPGEDAASALADPERLMERAIRRIRWLTRSRDPRFRHVASFNLELMDFEAAVINGEGTMIFSTPPVWTAFSICCSCTGRSGWAGRSSWSMPCSQTARAVPAIRPPSPPPRSCWDGVRRCVPVIPASGVMPSRCWA